MKEFISQKKQAFQALSQQNKFFQPGIIVMVVLLAAVGIYLIIRTFAATGSQTLNFAPTDDAFVNKGAPNANYGSATNLSVVGSSTTTTRRDSLLKFTVANLPAGKITGATLWLYVTNGTKNAGNVYRADPNWNESTVTWATKPALLGTASAGAALTSETTTSTKTSTTYSPYAIGAATAGTWLQIKVTSAVIGNGTVSFRIITASSNNAVFGSRESAHPPKLAITIDVPADTTPPTAPVLTGYPVSDTQLNLNWSGATDNIGVTSYDVYRNGSLYIPGTTNSIVALSGTPTGDSFTVVAKDAAGNASASSNALTLKTNPDDPTDRKYTTPEGAMIEINTQSGFTYDSIYRILKDNAYPGDFAAISKTLTVRVQDSYGTGVTPHCDFDTSGNPISTATLWITAVSSGFRSAPDSTVGHEYGHVWTDYHLCIDQHNKLDNYLNTRWDAVDGSTVIGTDPRLTHSYEWTPAEMLAEDYRLLFGSPLAVTETPYYVNTVIADPRSQPGLKDWFLNTWAVKQP